MSSRWLRDYPVLDGWYGNTFHWIKAFTQFLHKVLGFTIQSTTCPAGRSFTSTEKSGMGGSFGGSDWIFTGSGFDQSDAGKIIVLEDNTNPRNAGVYVIRRYISATQIEIDFQADQYQGEFPSAGSGINWWIYSKTYELPGNGDQIRLQSRHTTGWALEINFTTGGYTARSYIRVATSGDWTNGPILNRGTALYFYPCQGNEQVEASVINAEADYDGEWLNVFTRAVGNASTYYNEKWSMGGFVIARIDELEPGHSDDEKLVVCCALDYTYSDYSFWRSIDTTYRIGQVTAWSDLLHGVIYGAMVETTAGGYGYGFTKYVYREVNRRIGNKHLIIPGTLVILDYNNTSGIYQILGRIKGHYTTKAFVGGLGRNGDLFRAMLPMTRNSYKDLLMINDGWVINWPGVTPQH